MLFDPSFLLREPLSVLIVVAVIMLASPLAAFALVLTIALAAALALPGPAQAARDTNSYDGNIYALYAGNGSLVPPRSSLAQAMADHRVAARRFQPV